MLDVTTVSRPNGRGTAQRVGLGWVWVGCDCTVSRPNGRGTAQRVGLGWVWVETFNRFECFQPNCKLHRWLIEFGFRFEPLVEKKFNCKLHMDIG